MQEAAGSPTGAPEGMLKAKHRSSTRQGTCTGCPAGLRAGAPPQLASTLLPPLRSSCTPMPTPCAAGSPAVTVSDFGILWRRTECIVHRYIGLLWPSDSTCFRQPTLTVGHNHKTPTQIARSETGGLHITQRRPVHCTQPVRLAAATIGTENCRRSAHALFQGAGGAATSAIADALPQAAALRD